MAFLKAATSAVGISGLIYVRTASGRSFKLPESSSIWLVPARIPWKTGLGHIRQYAVGDLAQRGFTHLTYAFQKLRCEKSNEHLRNRNNGAKLAHSFMSHRNFLSNSKKNQTFTFVTAADLCQTCIMSTPFVATNANPCPNRDKHRLCISVGCHSRFAYHRKWISPTFAR